MSNLQPLHRWRPPGDKTFGDIAAKVGADLGLTPDAEQQWLLDSIYAEKAPGIPAAFQVCVIAPRQNLKSATLEIAALTDLFVLGVPLGVWTAHEFKTSRKSFEDMRNRILRSPEFESRCKFRDSHGEEAIILHTGEKLEFHARSTGSGRGFSCDRLTLDEALFLRPGDMGALLPTLVTRKDAQVRFASSAGLATSEVLRALRDRGRAANDASLAYVEYGAERRPCVQDACPHALDTPGCSLDAMDLLWQANCALWVGRVTEEALIHNRRGLPPTEFMREFFSWWEDPAGVNDILPAALWAGLVQVVEQPGSLTYSLEVPWGRADAVIGAAWAVDGRQHVEVAHAAAGTGWVVEWLTRAVAKRPGRVVIDSSAEAASLAQQLEDAAVPVTRVTGTERALACAGFYDAAMQGVLSHDGDPALAAALAAAVWKDVGEGARAFSRRKSGGDISRLYAVTLALHGLAAEPTYDLMKSFY